MGMFEQILYEETIEIEEHNYKNSKGEYKKIKTEANN